MSLESKMDRIIELLEKIEANTRWGGWVYPFPNWAPPSDNSDTGTWGGTAIPCTIFDLVRDEEFGSPSEAFCCSCPPGDGSTCAGGTCCCREDYVCDKCRIAAGD